MPGLDIITFGCRLNAFESEVIRGAACAAGLDDAVVVNTCAVTAEAERQARQAIRRARREHPNARIIVTGCAATLSPERYAALAEVDLVLDNTAKLRPESYAAINPPPPTADAADPPSAATREKASEGARARAYLQIQQGCDHRCTFCIIPYARGPSRSLPFAAIAENARDLVARGAGEIVLTGVDLTSYGADLPDQASLGSMVRLLLDAVPELRRLRLSSLDPSEIGADLWSLIATETRLMPHLHLSLQSGDDLILKRMKRRHSRADAVAFCARVRRLRPDIAFGADIIAGFPTETETMFARSEALVEECDLTFLHVFPYSPRPGTPAARMPQVAGNVVRERAKRLRATGEAALQRRLAAEVGSTRQVLIESASQGRTEHFIPVAISGETPGAVRTLVVAGHDGARLRT
jgi:threonylcarbamoyladenosine tRNA methylthiotransferase MtaB